MHKKLISILIILGCAVVSTAAYSGGNNNNGNNNKPTHELGDKYGGGIVFYVYDGGKHGLIAAIMDQGVSVRWGTDTVNPGATGNGVGSGEMNTTLIISSEFTHYEIIKATNGVNEPPSDFAAKVAADYAVKEDGTTLCSSLDSLVINETCYGGWFLPSVEELALMYRNLYKNGLGGFANDTTYWSSTGDNGVFDAQVWYFQPDGYHGWNSRHNAFRVRAVRAF